MTPEDQPPPILNDDREQLASDPGDVDALFASIAAQTVDKPPSPRETLRALPTATRTAAALGLMLVIGAIAIAIQGLRNDLSGADLTRFVASIMILAAVCAGSAGLALRGMHKQAIEPGMAWGMAIFALALPMLFASLPGWWPGMLIPAEAGWTPHFRCFGRGLLATVGTSTSVMLFMRADGPAHYRLAAAAGSGGLAGMAIQQLYCAGVNPLHLIGSHGSLGLAVGGIVLLVAAGKR